MGIITNAFSIVVGSFIGGIFKERIRFKNFVILGIAIMIISMVGFFENIYDIEEMTLKSSDLLVVVFALIIGTVLGDMLMIDVRLSSLSNIKNKGFSEFIDASVFFGVGGMQLCGPVMLATMGDSSQLILKSMIDFPFALMFGISYGKKVSLSALPVAAGQFVIIVLTLLAGDFLTAEVIKQICAMGYIILFFSGYNLVCENKNKINNVNMIIGILVILIYNVLNVLWR